MSRMHSVKIRDNPRADHDFWPTMDAPFGWKLNVKPDIISQIMSLLMKRKWPWCVAVVVLVSSLFALPATAATPKTGLWGGGTGQGRTMKFGVKRSGKRLIVKRIVISSLRYSCRGPSGYASSNVVKGATFGSYSGPTVVRKGGKFAVGPVPGPPPGSKDIFKGRFTSKHSAKGFLRSTYSHSATDCDTGRIPWHASLR